MQSKGASGQGTTRSESVGRQSAGGSTKSDIRLTAEQTKENEPDP
jgi:hypothetical protein